MRVSAKQLAGKRGWTYAMAANWLQCAVKEGYVKPAGSEAPAGGKGRSTQMYEVPDIVTFDLTEGKAVKITLSDELSQPVEPSVASRLIPLRPSA